MNISKSDLKIIRQIYHISGGALTAVVGILLFAIFLKLIYWQVGIIALLTAFGIYGFILFCPKVLLKIINLIKKENNNDN